MMKWLDPAFAERIGKFKKMRRSYYSLIILTLLFLFSLPAELLFNDLPLAVRINDKWFFPVLREYSYKDLGGQSDIAVKSYDDERFMLAVKRVKRIPDPEILFGDGKEFVSDSELLAEREMVRKMIADGGDKRPLYTYHQWGVPQEVTYRISAPVPYSYKSSAENESDVRQTYMPPFDWKGEEGAFRPVGMRFGHWLGTDAHGKDVLARIVYGFRVSLLFGLALAFSGAVIGTVIGALQGYFGGMTDLLGQRATEIWAAIPRLLLLMILSKFMSDYFFKIDENMHYLLLFCILNLTAWMTIASYMRAEFLRARNLEYVKAAKALGLSNVKIMFRHILPNSLTPIVTFLPFNVSAGILALVSLDFLGFGVKYPAPSLGELLLQGQQNLSAWWIIMPTFVILAFSLILLTFIGEGVRSAFDPRAK